MSVNFNDLLSRPVDSAKKPPTKPAGTYSAIIQSYKFDTSPKQKTPYVRFTLNNLSPGEDIAPENCRDEEGSPIDFSKWNPTKDFYLTDDALFRLKDFLKSLGISTDGRSFGETIPETKGMPVIIQVVQAASPDGKSIYANVGDISAG